LLLALLRHGGDSKRVKFVFITWVGENAPAMKKGSVVGLVLFHLTFFYVCSQTHQL
jgi:hypothetical protein